MYNNKYFELLIKGSPSERQAELYADHLGRIV